jgi:hypothetical protein
MNADNFVKAIETMYQSPYPPIVRGSVILYIDRKPEWYREIMLEVIQRKISTRYKAPPGIADFSEAEGEVYEINQAKEMKRPQIEAPNEKSQEGIEFLALLTSKMAQGINPGKDQEVQAALRKIESTYK